MRYPPVLDESLIGTYPAATNTGGGYVWDAVLEYRVWCHRDEGDYYRAFAHTTMHLPSQRVLSVLNNPPH